MVVRRIVKPKKIRPSEYRGIIVRIPPGIWRRLQQVSENERGSPFTVDDVLAGLESLSQGDEFYF